MPPTERLYYNDSHLIEFEARVIDATERVSGWTAVTLDRTAFYPTGGGQPSDTGTLNGTRVVECIDDENNGVLHVMQGLAPEIGSTVRGRVDWSRRLDHMQQHTGQHILSQALVTLFNAPTKSFRVMEESCEIDVDLANLTTEVIERAVELANNIIWEDRPITIRTVTPEEAAQLPLRKDPAREGELRLIEIEGFDLTPCGGTHAYRTGEIGMIAVRHWERAKGLTRIEFVAGTRALADYRRANKTARAVAALYSSARDDAAKLTARVLDENKELHRRVRVLEEIASRVEADELIRESSPTVRDAKPTVSEDETDHLRSSSPTVREGAEEPRDDRVITRIFDGRDAESLKHLAQALIAHPHTIALLGSREKDAARVVFARSADAAGDMNALIREACVLLDGRGGGRPDMAQGGGKAVDKLEEALELAKTSLKSTDG
ncbi:MAG TPA: DHHA1 domain-containing protein [Pyrinomonadaceae bacterium]|nr:DHHA1 domain-containing protein [Pyrinomonadaceae bacterium]